MTIEITLHAPLNEKMRLATSVTPGHHLLLDTLNQSIGPNAYLSPMEMLLVSLAGCSGISLLSILRKKRLDITYYEIRAYGEQAETYPRVFKEIHVEHILTGHALQEAAVQHALELTEERYCNVSIMLSQVTSLTQTFRLAEAT